MLHIPDALCIFTYIWVYLPTSMVYLPTFGLYNISNSQTQMRPMVLLYLNLQKTGLFFGGIINVGFYIPAPFCSHMGYGEYWKIRHKTTVDGGEILPFQPPDG